MMSGEAGEELDTPAARIMARRESRAAMPDRLKEAAPDDSSDEKRRSSFVSRAS